MFTGYNSIFKIQPAGNNPLFLAPIGNNFHTLFNGIILVLGQTSDLEISSDDDVYGTDEMTETTEKEHSEVKPYVRELKKPYILQVLTCSWTY